MSFFYRSCHLFLGKDVIEEAQEWLERNKRKGTSLYYNPERNPKFSTSRPEGEFVVLFMEDKVINYYNG